MPQVGFRVHTSVFSTGERFPLVLAEDGLPVSLPTRYVIDRKRNSRQSSTLRAIARTLSYFYDWALGVHEPFDPEIRLRSGPPLGGGEITSLARYLGAKRRFGTIAFPARRGGRKKERDLISNGSLNNQLDLIRDFVAWTAEVVRKPRAGEEEIRRLKTAFNAEHLTLTRPASKYGLTRDQQVRLLQLVDPGYSENPFNRSVRFRNRAIVSLLFESGIRRGELGKLRVEDVSVGVADTAFISVVRRADDPWDTRRNEPAVKTLGRRVPLSPWTAALLFEYLRRHRGRCRHPYFFTSSRGATPLDSSAINRIFARIGSTLDFAGVELTPHTMRRTFEDNLMRAGGTLGIDSDLLEKIVNYVSGWTPDSKQSATYQRRAIEEQTAKLMEVLQAQNARIFVNSRQRTKDGILA